MTTTKAMDATIEQARLGVLYLFGNMNCNESHTKTICNGLLDLGDEATSFYRGNIRATGGATRRIQIGARSIEVSGQQVQDKLQDALTRAIRQVVDHIDANASGRATPSSDSQSLFARIWLYLRDFVSDMTKKLVRKAADGMFSGLANWADAMVDAVTSGMAAYRVYMQGRTVAILPGVPSSVVLGITRAMNRTAIGKVYQAVKATLSLALNAASVLAKGIVELVASVIEIIVNAVWKIYEVLRFNQFCTEAKLHWEQRTSASPWHGDAKAFNAWYLLAVKRVPCIAALTLKSGLCGDSMHFLRMIDDSGAPISGGEYANGMTYMKALKDAGDKYLSDLGYAFHSENMDIRSLITMNGKPFRLSPEIEKEARKILGR